MSPRSPRAKVGLGILSQPPFLEYIGHGQWRLWLSYDKHATGAGTYLLLHANGRIDRTTEDEAGPTFTHLVKPQEV